jgi:hypothetical protein
MRRLPGPAGHRLGDGGDSRGSLRIVSGLAQNTNSIFVRTLQSLRPQMDLQFCLRAGTISREANVRSYRSRSNHNALSSARKENLCFSVDKDLHGWR